MHNISKNTFWSPYIVGAGIGILSSFTVYSAGKTIGTSSTFVHIVGFIESLFSYEYVNSSAYFQKIMLNKPVIDWQFALVVGLFIGAKISSLVYKTYQHSAVPALWAAAFGPSFSKRAFFAFVGGLLILFGARLAGGCTSGKAISSGLQLSISAWVFIATLFVTGIITAYVLYKK